MEVRSKIFDHWVRSSAAVTLLFWGASQGFCAANCAGMAAGDGSSEASCRGGAVTESHSHNDEHSSNPTPHDSSQMQACLTLKSALANAKDSVSLSSGISLLYLLAPFRLMFGGVFPEPAGAPVCHAKTREWLSTPVVCTSPANRGHAPPASC